MGCVQCTQLGQNQLKSLNGMELLDERSADDPQLRENLLLRAGMQDPCLVLSHFDGGCIRSTDASDLQDPNRARGAINTGIVDIDGDGVEPLEMVSAIFMGHPSDQPTASLPSGMYKRGAFRSFQSDYRTHQDAETEAEELNLPVNKSIYDLGNSLVTDGLADPNRSHGGINTGIVDIDGDGVEVLELLSAVFMGYPSSQPVHPPVDPAYFLNTNMMFNQQVAGEMRAEERALAVLNDTNTGNTPAAFRKQVAFEMLAEEIEEFPPPLTHRIGENDSNEGGADFLDVQPDDIMSSL